MNTASEERKFLDATLIMQFQLQILASNILFLDYGSSRIYAVDDCPEILTINFALNHDWHFSTSTENVPKSYDVQNISFYSGQKRTKFDEFEAIAIGFLHFGSVAVIWKRLNYANGLEKCKMISYYLLSERRVCGISDWIEPFFIVNQCSHIRLAWSSWMLKI